MTIALDNETYLISREHPAPKPVCTTTYDIVNGSNIYLANTHEFFKFWVDLLEGEKRIIGHNITYDMSTMFFEYELLKPLIFKAYADRRVYDTQVMQQFYDIYTGRVYDKSVAKYYSLSMFVKMFFDEEMEGKKGEDIWRLRYSELANVPLNQWPEEATEYALLDALWTYRVYEMQMDNIADMLDNVPEQTFANFALNIMTVNGMYTNAKKVEELEFYHKQEMEKLLPELEDAGLIKNGVKKRKKAQELIQQLCDAKGIDPILTKTDQIAINKAACVWVDSDLLMRKAEYQEHEKIISTYIPFLKYGTEDLPITTMFGMAATGRTTSSSPWKPLVGGNLQNAPRKGGVRECFKPRNSNYVYMLADFSGAELHTLAETCLQLFGYSVLGEKLNEGVDVHSFVGSHMLEMPYSDFIKRLKEPEIKEARFRAKAANFGFPAGMGIKAFIMNELSKGMLWREDEVKRVKEAWLNAFPEMSEFFNHVKLLTQTTGAAKVVIPYTNFTRECSGYSTVANTYFQGSAAFGAKKALTTVVEACYTGDLKGCIPVNFIHDEIILEVPRDKVTEYDSIFGGLMSSAFNDAVCPNYPTDVDVIATEIWSKKADRIVNDEGELQIWTQ